MEQRAALILTQGEEFRRPAPLLEAGVDHPPEQEVRMGSDEIVGRATELLVSPAGATDRAGDYCQ